jgi:aldose 1-epimerase
VSLHGGPTGYDAVVWEKIGLKESKLFSKGELEHVSSLNEEDESESSYALFTYTSPDGDQGFPGRLRVETFLALVPGKATDNVMGSVVIFYRAKLEEEGKVTPVNLTQHWGFNLDASLKDGSAPSVREHTMDMKASHWAELDSDALATGTLVPVSSDPNHLLTGGPIGKSPPPGGYDHFYLLTPRPSLPPFYATRITLSPSLDIVGSVLSLTSPITPSSTLVSLSSPKSGISLSFDSNQSGLMFYTNNFADGSGSAKKIHGLGPGAGKGGYEPFSAAFLEFHEPIAAFLHEGMQQRGDDTLLASGEVYSNWVRMEVGYERVG